MEPRVDRSLSIKEQNTKRGHRAVSNYSEMGLHEECVGSALAQAKANK